MTVQMRGTKSGQTQKNERRGRPHSWTHPNLVACAHDALPGRGVFAKKAIPKGTLLTIFGGHVLTRQEELELSPRLRDLGFQISPHFVLGPRHEDEIGISDFYNHSCNPNAGFNGHIFLQAIRRIAKGEQVCFDYAMVLGRTPGLRRQYVLDCTCGASNCRKRITTSDWQRPELQKRYKGYFQRYLEDKIECLRNGKR